MPTAALPTPRTLPPQPTRLIGREDELARIRALLVQEGRLLTLTGPGGVGKTRLAIAAAEQVAERFPDGVWFVDLVPLIDGALVAPTIARAIGVREQPGQVPLEALCAVVGDQSILLVLDNIEHLLAAAPILDALLGRCPKLMLLATSREPLRLRREQVVEVRPLPVPGTEHASWTVANLAAMPAIQLFVVRAQAADATFELSSANAATIAELSRGLEGLPLAVELAAARIRLFEPKALLARVHQSLALLRWEASDLPSRHRSLHATLDWSYALLTPDQQALFRRLSVFAGGFSLAAAEALVATSDPGSEPLEVLTALADKHLVQVLENADGEPRFGLLATVREYALEWLKESGELEATRDRHLAYFLALADQGDRAMYGPDEQPWLNRLEAEHDNLRQAHDWAVIRDDVEAEWRLVAALARFWLMHGYLREGMERVEAALSRSYEANPAMRARVLEGAGLIAHMSGDQSRAIAHHEASLFAARAAGDAARAARALGFLGAAAYSGGDPLRARALVENMLNEARAADAGAMVGLAFIYRVLFAIGPHGSPREREQLRDELNEPELRLRQAGSPRGLALLLAGRARLLLDVDPPASRAALREALALSQERGDPLVISIVPWLAAVLLVEHLPAEQVARLCSGVAALAERSAAVGGRTMIDHYGAPQDRLVLAHAVSAARVELGEAAFAAAVAAGRALSFDELLAELQAVLEDGEVALANSTSAPSLLSPREQEVLALVARGLTNRQIGDALFISPRTVNFHVTNLLAKLELDSRAAAAAFAVRHGLA